MKVPAHLISVIISTVSVTDKEALATKAKALKTQVTDRVRV